MGSSGVDLTAPAFMTAADACVGVTHGAITRAGIAPPGQQSALNAMRGSAPTAIRVVPNGTPARPAALDGLVVSCEQQRLTEALPQLTLGRCGLTRHSSPHHQRPAGRWRF
jgi:hypothetical protein